MTAAREVEKGDLSAFADVYGITNHEFRDKPDLIFYEKNREIGVEHRRIYVNDVKLATGGQLLPQEKIHWAIIDQARDIFRRKSTLHLWVITMFTIGVSNYRKADIADTAKLLANTILEDINVHQPVVPRERRQIYVGGLKYRGLPYPKGIVSISYSVEEDPKMDAWGPSYGYGVPELTPEILQASIDTKNEKIVGYRQCDEMWLLMVTDAGMPSSHFRIPDTLVRFDYDTQFDRLFLFIRAENRPVELRVRQ